MNYPATLYRGSLSPFGLSPSLDPLASRFHMRTAFEKLNGDRQGERERERKRYKDAKQIRKKMERGEKKERGAKEEQIDRQKVEVELGCYLF